MKGASTGLPSPEAAVRRSYCSSATPWVSEENLHDRPVASKEIESVIKNLPRKENLGPYGFTSEFFHFEEDLDSLWTCINSPPN